MVDTQLAAATAATRANDEEAVIKVARLTGIYLPNNLRAKL